jgi:MarR family transcriptional regulator, 2-MHQ and catechol-resistance regulon repressor
MSHDLSRRRLALLTYGRLMRAANALRTHATRQLENAGLTLSQFAVLEALFHLGPMSLSEVAKKILTTGGNLTMVAGNLEKQGFVARKISPDDARVSILSLTPKGKKVIGEIFPEHANAIADACEILTSKEQRKLAELCRKLARAEQD